MRSFIFFLSFLTAGLLFGQGGFTYITDPLNPVVNFHNVNVYRGAAWVDVDNDDDIDLFCAPDNLFLNDGRGNFISVFASIGRGQNQKQTGSTWGDFDNDGDIDCFLARGPSLLYLNDGTGNFTADSSALEGLSATVNGWAAAFGDYNSDGVLDLVIAHPAGFLANPSPSFIFKGTSSFGLQNLGGYDFTQINAPYTVPYWSDFDLDGDLDLFIASGPGGTAGKDFLYRNLKTETGVDSFAKITDLPFASENQDGQTYNFIDYDNDGDLDLCLTNWLGAANRFYKNDNGIYTLLTVPFNYNQSSLGNSWGDFDNDGDLDLVIANDSYSFTGFYLNNGDGTFTDKATAFTTKRGANSPVIGDYDNDGDLDLYIYGHNTGKGLFRNDSLALGKNFISIKLHGVISNGSAIGAKVRVKATINGVAVWQMREVSAQNTFQGMNDLRVHFGLYDASVVDSVVVWYPSGATDIFTSVPANSFYKATEGSPVLGVVTSMQDGSELLLPGGTDLFHNYPNPFNPETIIRFRLNKTQHIKLSVYSMTGEVVEELFEGVKEGGSHQLAFSAAGMPSGVYIYRLITETGSFSEKMCLVR